MRGAESIFCLKAPICSLNLSGQQWSSDSWILINVELGRGTAQLEKQHFRSAKEKAVNQFEQPRELSQ